MAMNRRAKAHLSHPTLSEMIFHKTQYPGSEIQGVLYNIENDSFTVFFTHSDLPEVQEADISPDVLLLNDEDEKVKIEG